MDSPSTPPLKMFRKSAFTLIEMMVSITILVVLILLITHLFNSAVTLSTNGNKHMEADSEARTIFDRMAVDFGNMVKRTDVDYYFKKNVVGNNDELAFYSQSAGYYSAGVTAATQGGSVSLIGYRINNDKLERLSKGLTWNGVSPGGGQSVVFNPQTIAGVWQGITAGGADPDYQVMGDGIFRMEVCFLVRSPTNTPASVPPVAPYLSNSAIVPTPTPLPVPSPSPLPGFNPTPTPVPSVYNGMKDVVAIVVTIAVLDPRSQSVLQPGALAGAATALPDSVAGAPGTMGTPPGAAWQHIINSGGLNMLPAAAASQVRIYQRYFYLNPVDQYL